MAKVVDFIPLGALSRPGPPDPDLARFHIKVTPMEHQWSTPKSLKFHWFYSHFEIMNSYQIQKSLKFHRFYLHFEIGHRVITPTSLIFLRFDYHFEIGHQVKT